MVSHRAPRNEIKGDKAINSDVKWTKDNLYGAPRCECRAVGQIHIRVCRRGGDSLKFNPGSVIMTDPLSVRAAVLYLHRRTTTICFRRRRKRHTIGVVIIFYLTAGHVGRGGRGLRG